MNRETIDRAASLLENSGFHGEEKDLVELGFRHGAEWRINSVWHSPKEEPEAYRLILVEFTYEDGDLGYELGLKQICLSEEAASNMVRWAYISDLLPNRKEVQP